MSFLPEEDREFLADKGIKHQLMTEKTADGAERCGVVFPEFAFGGNLRVQSENALVVCGSCDVLVLIPAGYSTTKLDSFYTLPRLRRPDGTDPQSTSPENPLFENVWQFWSRHLDDKDWRVGIDGLCTYINYIRRELRDA
jgi:hypothetical protein